MVDVVSNIAYNRNVTTLVVLDKSRDADGRVSVVMQTVVNSDTDWRVKICPYKQ